MGWTRDRGLTFSLYLNLQYCRKQANIHTHVCNAVTLVLGLLWAHPNYLYMHFHAVAQWSPGLEAVAYQALLSVCDFGMWHNKLVNVSIEWVLNAASSETVRMGGPVRPYDVGGDWWTHGPIWCGDCLQEVCVTNFLWLITQIIV